MDKNFLVVALVGVLLAVSVFQAFQLNGLNEKIKDVNEVAAASAKVPVQTQASAPTAKPASSSASVPQNLNSLPQMVGGC